MSMNSSRSRPLHNFAFPHLKWGNQRILRCTKETGNSLEIPNPKSVEILRCRVSNICSLSPEKPSPLDLNPSETVKNDLKSTNGIDEVKEKFTFFTPPPHVDAENLTAKTYKPRKRSRQQQQQEEEPKAKLSISLTREEVINDFLAITGNLPVRRPKKRSRIVQNQINTILPGFWLTEVKPEDY